jgi:hypothetical protein
MESPLLILVTVLLMAWVGSYFYSYQYSRRKLTFLARWLEDALPLLGSNISSRWLNQNTLSIEVKTGKDKIREAMVVLGTVRREIFAWLLSTLRGGKDSMTLLVALNTSIRSGTEFEIFRKNDPVPKTVLLGLGGLNDWEIQDYPREAPYRIASRLDESNELATRLITLLLDEGYDIRRISVRTTTPHLMVVLNITHQPRGSAHDLLQLIRNLAEDVVGQSVITRDKNNPPRSRNRPKEKRAAKAPVSDNNPLLSLGAHHVPENFGKPGDPSAN